MPLPNGMGLTPVVPSSVAPKGMPAGATGALPVMPSGDVGSMPGGETDGICASAGLPPMRAAAIATINQHLTRVLLRSPRIGADPSARHGRVRTFASNAASRAADRDGVTVRPLAYPSLWSMHGNCFFGIAASGPRLLQCDVGGWPGLRRARLTRSASSPAALACRHGWCRD